MSTSFLEAFASLPSGSSSNESGGITSSPNSSVSIVRMPSRGRIATRFSFERMTTRATPTLFASFIASSSSA